MMYSFVELPDETIISHSEMITKDGTETVKIYIETPDEEKCFKHATYYLTEQKWEEIYCYSKDEIAYFTDFIESEKHLILEFAKNGGIKNASGL